MSHYCFALLAFDCYVIQHSRMSMCFDVCNKLCRPLLLSHDITSLRELLHYQSHVLTSENTFQHEIKNYTQRANE